MPSGDNTLVQEVVRVLLEGIYEPIFADQSHGCRPQRSCHTALSHIQHSWSGMVWLVDIDIQGFYDNSDHDVLKDLKKISKNGTMVDVQPNTARHTRSRTEIVQRFEAQTCEYCGKDEGYFEVHHVRKLKDLHGKERWQHVMASMQRKTLVVCNVCHDLLHQGTLPDWRYQAMKRRAGFHESGKSGSGGG